MQLTQYRRLVMMDGSNLLETFIRALEDHGVSYCVIGGQAVNAYVDPLVSLDLDIVIAARDIEKALGEFKTEQFPHSLNIVDDSSKVRIQVQTDERYQDFIQRAAEKTVLGLDMMVADVADVLQGKLWAFSDATRRGSKRQKDLADITRLVETFPDLLVSIPETIRSKINLDDEDQKRGRGR